MVNYVIRAVQLSDIESLAKLTESTHIGLTSLSKHRQVLQEKIERSVGKFQNFPGIKKAGSYLFVAENLQTHEIAGVCSLHNWEQNSQELYFFLIETLAPPHSELPWKQDIQVLHPIAYNEKSTEFRGLFVSPQHQGEGLGYLLSKSRCLFLAAYPHLVESIVFAQMQGFSDERTISPFWNAIGHHFLDLHYNEIMRRLQQSRAFIADFLPKYPIYVPLLPKPAQEVIGKTHPFSARALRILAQEGFQMTKEIDLFDAGRKIEAFTQELLSVRKSIAAPVAAISECGDKSVQSMLCNNRLDFRCCSSRIQIDHNGEVILDPGTARALDVEIGESIRYVL